MSDTRVAVVILNYNGKHFLEQFLPSTIQHSFPHEIYVADNGSTDGSVAFLQEQFPQVKVIANGWNYGYARGYNLALIKIEADYFVLLNNDVEVTPGWIGNILSLMDQDAWIAACQPKVLDFKERDRFEYAGAAGGFIDKYGYPFCRGRVFNTIELDETQFNDAREVFWATGACLFIRKEAYWQVGGLDDDYFAHMEEIDLCWRLRNFGYKIYVQPASTVYHIGGGTLSKISTRKTYLNFRNNLVTLTKNHRGKKLLYKILYRMIFDGIAAFKFLFEGQPGHFLAVIRAHFSYYARIPSTFRKRRRLKRSAGFAFNSGCIYNGNIVLEYFLRNKTRFNELLRGFLPD